MHLDHRRQLMLCIRKLLDMKPLMTRDTRELPQVATCL